MISLQDVSDAAVSLVVAGVIGTTSFIGWIIRRALTNQKQIEMLSNAITSRDELSTVRDTAIHRRMDELQKDIRETRQNLHERANQ